ncbi:ATP-dependent DNA helicase [Variovorax sp. HJSM1_2]|uniref:ATP-dependent DNA helicase n=1 Tax=Variovorax sp. HJSM1_2 TaxID=3366263 RepID=UPI003BE5F77A
MHTPPITVSVRALCEFTAKAGDLDLRFTPSPSAIEGMLGHASVRRRRAPAYEAEISLQGQHGPLLVRGRADGFDPALQQLEEIKTYRGDLAAQAANQRALHWAQLRIYGWLLCQQRGLVQLQLALVYFNITTQQETLVSETATAARLEEHFHTQCARYLDWAEQEKTHRTQRDQALAALAFPHPAFRTGQRELSKAVYQVQRAGRCLLAQAPTGIGKTVGTLFPALKAMPGQDVDKLFFLTAKTSGRQLALDAAQQLQTSPKQAIRILELVARDKACEHPDKACHGESCPLARGFYDRLPAARQSATIQPLLARNALRDVALQHQVCPYYLGQEMVRWSDLVVGDVNYYFDSSALLHSLAQQNEWRVTLLIDEAHNLLERARQMYSATLDHIALRLLRRTAPAALQKPLDRLHRQWLALLKPLTQAYTAFDTVPAKFLGALQNASNAIGEYFAEHPTEVEPALQRFQFDTAQFVRLAEGLADGLVDPLQGEASAASDTTPPAPLRQHSLFDIQRPAEDPAASRLTLRCVVPAPHLAQRLANAHAVVLFSATLSPRHFYQDMLGLPANSAWIDVAAPFSADQLTVQVARHISTRYNDRAASLQPMAEQMAAQYSRLPGHYLAFFSSYDYLQQAADAFALHAPDVPIWRQSRRMLEAEQTQFLARFVPGGRGIGFAVLGGVFSEGIDLPGDRLIGAFIATLGLPQVNPVNEQFRARLQATFGHSGGSGYDYAYLFPGLQKVVQAAGRVIRTPQDQGTLLLLDQRFARAEIRRLLPAWWSLHRL